MYSARFEESGGALLVTPLAPRLDAVAAPEFRDVVGAHARGRALLVISLEHVTYLDESGLAALVAVLKRMAPGGVVRLVKARPRIRALLEATFLDELFPVFDDPASAVRI